MNKLLPTRAAAFFRRAVEHSTYPTDFAPGDVELCRWVAPYTMTSPERVLALRDAVLHIVRNQIAGPIVECGVWRGGSMMVAARTLAERGDIRDLFLFDTFSGMPPPSAVDVAWNGVTAAQVLQKGSRSDSNSAWCIADEADVRKNLALTRYPNDRIHLVPGLVEQTIPAAAPERIALLRLDTDWYESTQHELVHLYPRLVSGGVLIIDDYGHWQGARKAVDEYLATLNPCPLLTRVDSTGRLLVKP